MSSETSAERRGAPATVVHVMTVPLSLRFLSGQPRFISERGFTCHVITSPGVELDEFGRSEGVPVHGVEMPRRITPLRDLVAVWRLWRLLRSLRPDVVHAHTPKGGLLGMIAAWLARVPVRIYHIHGLPYVTQRGAKRLLLESTERLSAHLATCVLAVSESMRRLALQDDLCPDSKVKVLLGGTSNGVDALRRFRPLPAAVRAATRERLGIPLEARVVGFVGRLVRDKGVAELAEAWRSLREEFPDAHLLVVGPLEERDALPPDVVERLRSDASVHLVGFENDTPPLFAAMDVVALPTYREGFPNVPLEAAAMELPIVATLVPGCTDAVADGITGTLVPARDAAALSRAIAAYLRDPALSARHGLAGRERILRDFQQEALWEAVAHEYDSLLAGARGSTAPASRRTAP